MMTGCGIWRKAYQEVSNRKPLFTAIYATVLVGVLFSSFYVLAAVYSSSTPWRNLSSSPAGQGRSSVPLPTTSGPRNSSSRSKPRNVAMRPIWEAPPKDKKMPPLETFRLTKGLVEQHVKDNVIIVTFGNYAFMDFILTWVKHLTDLGVSNLLVGAMDTKLLEALYWKGIPVYDMGSHMSTADVGWGSPTFHKMGREKVVLIDAILPFGYELLMCDTDMVWLKGYDVGAQSCCGLLKEGSLWKTKHEAIRDIKAYAMQEGREYVVILVQNPLPYLARYPDADILTSTDQVVPTVVDDSLEIWKEVGAAYNIGIFHWRPTETSMKLVKEWKELLLSDDKIWDQNGFNDIVHKQLGPSLPGNSGLLCAFDGNLKLGLLPASIFCSGHTYFVQAMPKQFMLHPYAVHTTFQYAGTEGKRHRLREGMLFYDPPEYYDVPVGFLSFKPSIPKSLLLDGPHNTESHFKLVNYQIKQIRTALAVASLLNRTLVMPPLWCRLDRLWFPHPGVLAGSVTRQPFLCPLDHVFEVHVMLKDFPEEEFGPQINIREYSFLDNPSLPKQFKTVFESFKDVKVIQFSSMQDAFEGFADKKWEEKFRNRVKRYVGIWCCLQNHNPGHIYYDMYWDDKPDWRPIPPQTTQDDHPPW